MIKVTSIKLPEIFDNYNITDSKEVKFLEPISKINIFVGSNNSGKSRFLRLLSSQANQEVQQNSLDLKSTVSELSSIIDKIQDFMRVQHLVRISGVDLETFKSLQLSLDDLLTLGADRYEKLRTQFADLSRGIVKLDTKTGQIISTGVGKLIHEKANYLCREAKKVLDKLPTQTLANSPKKVYIPTLRGLRPLDANHTDLYAQRTKQDYYEDSESAPEIFTGLSLYQQLINLLLGNNTERNRIQSYQNFISETLYEGAPIALIPKPHEKIIVVKIGKEKEQPIHLLGDGIQSAIILSFLPFVRQEQTFFFIEEPEMYMHPGLQRKILNFFNSLEQHTFFLTTHSNHFLDITIDIKDASIFTFNKILGESDEEEIIPNFTIEAVDSGNESSLELLGVRNSSVFLVNATIWVEGITDRWYLRRMLNSYMNYLEESSELDLRLEEDTHYSFVEYGGANITHWSFLDYEDHPIEVKRLCAKAIVIIDKDGEKKEKRKDDLEKVLDDQLIILQCREVENLLPYKVIKEVVKEYEKNDELKLPEFTYEKYRDNYLGTFIESKILKNTFSRKGGYKEKSGTIKRKTDFCERALPKIKYEELPDSTKEVIKNIYQFIYERNS